MLLLGCRRQRDREREGKRYGIEGEYVRAGMEGRAYQASSSRRTPIDWLLMISATGLFAVLATMAKLPHAEIGLGWAVALTVATLTLLVTCAIALWRTTQFR